MPDLTSLVVTLKNHPVCTGVLPVTTPALTLYYGTTSIGRINFSNASAEELERLNSSCAAATFGLKKEDVLDESYRKAGKLNADEFASKFDLVNSGLLDVVTAELLEGNEATTGLVSELYNLNVYGEGSFFKVHRDTPRDDRMFGSLVIVFPSAHVGGTLVMRHGGQEWEFDSGALLRDVSSESPAIAYAAFYSDVEHEVLPVTAGYRVTITYNLYHPDPTKNPVAGIVPPAAAVSRLPFYTALWSLLVDPSFVPEGSTIGFGLSHKYPVSERTELSDIAERLKGPDATVFNVCQALKLDPQLRVLYDFDWDKTQIICDSFVDLDELDMYEDDLFLFLQEHGGEIYPGNGEGKGRIIWVTPPTDNARIKQNYMAYGNEAELVTQYADVCLIVQLPALYKRLEILDSIKAAGDPEA